VWKLFVSRNGCVQAKEVDEFLQQSDDAFDRLGTAEQVRECAISRFLLSIVRV
jgi:hypothetical protein